MTTPAPATPAPAPAPARPVNVANVLRAIISILETLLFIVGAIFAGMNNGQDFKHAIFAALLGFIAHGVNHNAGGSPV